MGSSICDVCRPVLVAALVVIIGVRPATVRAQADQPAAKRAAESKLQQGVALLKDGRYAEALARFKEGYALVPSPLILYDFGLAQLGMGDDRQALDSFEEFLRGAPDAPEDKRRKAAEYRDDLRKRVGAVTPNAEPSAPAIRPAPPAPPVAIQIVPPAPAVAPEPTRVAPSHRTQWWALTAAAAGTVSIGAGLTFGLLAANQAADVTADSQNRRVFVPADETSGLRDQRLEIVFLSVGAAAVLTGLGIYAFIRHRDAAGANQGSP